MRRAKFSFNAFVLIFALLGALVLLITVGVTGMTGRPSINEIFPIGETGYSVRHCDVTPSGIYKGVSGPGELVLKGTFDGNDWGSYFNGTDLLCNEYSSTTLGITMCDVVKVNVDTFEKELLFRDAILIGQCRSGEAVIIEGFSTMTWMSDTNPLYKLYMMSDNEGLSAEHVTVRYLDPETLETVFTNYDASVSDAASGDRDMFLDVDLGEAVK